MNLIDSTTRTVRVAALSGGVSSPSSTRRLVDHLTGAVERQLRAHGHRVRTDVVELREYAEDATAVMIGAPASDRLREVFDLIGRADVLIVGTPVFRGSYTGLLKTFLDVIDTEAVAGKPVLLAATGGSLRHALVIDHELRPLFAFFRAATAPTGVFATQEDCATEFRPDTELEARIERAAVEVVALADARPAVGQVSSSVAVRAVGAA